LVLAAEEGVDIVDAAMAPLSGMTSQVNLNALVEGMRGHERDPGIKRVNLQATADYWEGVRRLYWAFETGQLAPAADIYDNEMPGGQSTNLYQQAVSLGLGDRWREVCKMYAQVNTMFGDIVKVTPTSKVVGDMALFMVGNSLVPKDIHEGNRELSFQNRWLNFLKGDSVNLMEGSLRRFRKGSLRTENHWREGLEPFCPLLIGRFRGQRLPKPPDWPPISRKF
jgi:pyruvate carboxylase